VYLPAVAAREAEIHGIVRMRAHVEHECANVGVGVGVCEYVERCTEGGEGGEWEGMVSGCVSACVRVYMYVHIYVCCCYRWASVVAVEKHIYMYVNIQICRYIYLFLKIHTSI